MPYASYEAQRAFQRQWYAKRRKTWIREHGPCVLCGSRRSLQVDHIDPAKKISHNVWSWSKIRREAELAKCQVLCKKCHEKKSTEEGSVPAIRHGTRNRYHSGCRCSHCVEWNTQFCAQKRARRKERSGLARRP